jgi:hypothetical protein
VTVTDAPDDNLEHEDRNSVAKSRCVRTVAEPRP